jgi:tetratricopeptide (TPR) repeat protein
MPMLRQACLITAITFGSLGSALAEEPESPRVHYERANAAFALGNYAKAAEEYERAFELRPDPALLFNAAQSHRLGGNNARALLLYQNYLRLFGDRINNADETRRHITDLQTVLATEERSREAGSSGTLSPPSYSSLPRAPEVAPAPSPAPAATATVTAPPTPTPPQAKRPLVKRGWFWGVIAGVAVVAATSVALGVTLGSSTVYPTPSMGSARGN